MAKRHLIAKDPDELNQFLEALSVAYTDVIAEDGKVYANPDAAKKLESLIRSLCIAYAALLSDPVKEKENAARYPIDKVEKVREAFEIICLEADKAMENFKELTGVNNG